MTSFFLFRKETEFSKLSENYDYQNIMKIKLSKYYAHLNYY